MPRWFGRAPGGIFWPSLRSNIWIKRLGALRRDTCAKQRPLEYLHGPPELLPKKAERNPQNSPMTAD
eukprot:9473280-Pyramimonas_sp.AAC.1